MVLSFKSRFKLKYLDIILMAYYPIVISSHELHFGDTTPSFVCRHPSSVNKTLASLAPQKQTWACWADCAFLCGDCSSFIFCLSFLNILSRRRSYRLDRRRLQSVGEISGVTVQHPDAQSAKTSSLAGVIQQVTRRSAHVRPTWRKTEASELKSHFRLNCPQRPL